MSKKQIEVSKDSGLGDGQVSVPTSIPLDPYANVTRLLSEKDMTSPAVQKLLLSENDRMSRELARLHELAEKYYSRDKEAAILEEKLKQSTGAEVLFTFCETGGSASVGISPLFWDNNGWILLLLGLVFILGGILFKFVKR